MFIIDIVSIFIACIILVILVCILHQRHYLGAEV